MTPTDAQIDVVAHILEDYWCNPLGESLSFNVLAVRLLTAAREVGPDRGLEVAALKRECAGRADELFKAVAAERERCARIADEAGDNSHFEVSRNLAAQIAAAIRAGDEND